MRVLIVTNMWPTPARPAFGVFVRDQVDALRALDGLGQAHLPSDRMLGLQEGETNGLGKNDNDGEFFYVVSQCAAL